MLTRGDHARLDELPVALQRSPTRPARFAPGTLVNVPVTPPSGLLNPLTVGAFNEFWFRKAPRFQVGKPHHMTGFFHPLDGVGSWNRLYGTWGFLQYQFVVGDEQAESVRKIIERLTEVKLASFLAVLKRFGPGDPGPLSFPMPGWTLALDLPVGSDGLDRLLDEFDEEVASVGGRVDLAKDSRLAPDMFERMYPDVDVWRAVRDRIDPENVLQSDLSRRLGLTDHRTHRDTGAAARPWPTPAKEVGHRKSDGQRRAGPDGGEVESVRRQRRRRRRRRQRPRSPRRPTNRRRQRRLRPSGQQPRRGGGASKGCAGEGNASQGCAGRYGDEGARRYSGSSRAHSRSTSPGAAGAQPGTGRSQR